MQQITNILKIILLLNRLGGFDHLRLHFFSSRNSNDTIHQIQKTGCNEGPPPVGIIFFIHDVPPLQQSQEGY